MVVVGTCPDFGVITAIPQPLRWVARDRGLRLARAQANAVRAAGGVPVPLADLLSPDFRQAPEVMFSDDRYHPSAAGYALAAKQLLPALCHALGEWTGDTAPGCRAPAQRIRALADRLRTADAGCCRADHRGPRTARRARGLAFVHVVKASQIV